MSMSALLVSPFLGQSHGDDAEAIEAWREGLDLLGPFAEIEALAAHVAAAPPGVEVEVEFVRMQLEVRRSRLRQGMGERCVAQVN